MRGLIAALALALSAAPALAGPLSPSTARPTAPDTGERLFSARCGYCHLAGGTGTQMLTRRLGPGRGLLAERTDLQAGYVKGVVRQGLASMPALTRVEVTDPELDKIAAYLSRVRGGK